MLALFRQAMFLERRPTEWDRKPDNFESYRRSIVIVCQPMCLLELERAKYPKLNAFMMEFRSTNTYSNHLKWSSLKNNRLPCDSEDATPIKEVKEVSA